VPLGPCPGCFCSNAIGEAEIALIERCDGRVAYHEFCSGEDEQGPRRLRRGICFQIGGDRMELLLKERTSASVFSRIIETANPTFIAIAVLVPVGALVYAVTSGSLLMLNYVHVMAGALWTGIDLFMGFALGPILGSMDPRERTAVFMRLMPRMTFLMPVLAGVTATAGFQLTEHMGFSLVSPWILAALVVTALLAVQGFAVLLPNEIRIFRELLSDTPDVNRISRLGMQNAKLGGVQGVFQLAIIFIMATIRF